MARARPSRWRGASPWRRSEAKAPAIRPFRWASTPPEPDNYAKGRSIMRSTGYFCLLLRFMILLAVLAVPGRVAAQDRLGGHFGAVFPLVTHVNGETTTIGDDFTIG